MSRNQVFNWAFWTVAVLMTFPTVSISIALWSYLDGAVPVWLRLPMIVGGAVAIYGAVLNINGRAKRVAFLLLVAFTVPLALMYALPLFIDWAPADASEESLEARFKPMLFAVHGLLVRLGKLWVTVTLLYAAVVAWAPARKPALRERVNA